MQNAKCKMQNLLCIVGPTATGKTEVALGIARRLDGEIVGADSMQIYRDVRIASAKPSSEEIGDIPYHLIDCVSIGEAYSAARYQQAARTVIDDILVRGKLPVLTGGTGLYVDTVLYDMKFDEAGSNLSYQERLLSNKRLYDARVFGLTYPREVLYQRIENRIDRMMSEGLVDEIAAIYNRSYAESTGLQFLGYKEIGTYLHGEASLSEAVNLLKRNSRRYAKRQLTWFRHMQGIKWIDLSRFQSADDAVSYIINNKLECRMQK